MTRRRLIVSLAIAAGCAGVAAQEPAIVAGVVVSADTGTPVRRANVSATLTDRGGRMMPLPGGELSALTDDQGRYELYLPTAGSWRLAASKAGYLTHQYGQRRPFEKTAPVTVARGQRLVANVSLARAAAIEGRVVDEFSEPLAGARIQLFRSRTSRQQRLLEAVGEGDLSDDTGAFRLHGLAPGEYYVAASIRVAPLDSVVQTTYAPTYYPGTGNFAEAERVVVGTGADVHIAFPVRPIRTARIEGFVADSSGAPASAFLNLVSEADEMGAAAGIGAATRDDGSFLMADVPPGTYTLYASLRGGGYESEVTALPLTVFGDDISGLSLSTAKPGTIRVMLVPDAGVTRPLPRSVDVMARLARAGGESRHGAAAPAAPEAMLTPPGPFRLEPSIPNGWAVKAILVDGVEMTDTPIDVKARQDVRVQLVLTDKVSLVTGSVTAASGDRASTVVVFAEDSLRWPPPSRFVRSAAPDEKGVFRIAGLPGGIRYLAVAVDGLEEGEAADTDFLTLMKDRAVSFPLAEGEQRTIGLAVEPRP